MRGGWRRCGARLSQRGANSRHRRRDGDDDDGLQHVHDLLGHDGVHRQSALGDRREHERGQHHTDGVITADDGHRDPEEAGAGRKGFLIVMLVTEHEIESADSGDRAGEGHRAPPHARHLHGAVLGGAWLEAGRPQLESGPGAEQEPPRDDRDRDREKEHDIRRRAVERGNELRQPRQRAGVDLPVCSVPSTLRNDTVR